MERKEKVTGDQEDASIRRKGKIEYDNLCDQQGNR